MPDVSWTVSRGVPLSAWDWLSWASLSEVLSDVMKSAIRVQFAVLIVPLAVGPLIELSVALCPLWPCYNPHCAVTHSPPCASTFTDIRGIEVCWFCPVEVSVFTIQIFCSNARQWCTLRARVMKLWHFKHYEMECCLYSFMCQRSAVSALLFAWRLRLSCSAHSSWFSIVVFPL